jgi:chromosome segregation ATPase
MAAAHICDAHNADIDALETEIQQFRDAYAHDREIMADNVAQLGSYESRIDALEAENAVLRKCANGFKERHNIVAKAYTEVFADRDELQRRLDDVVALINQHAPKVHVYTKYEGAGTSIRVKEERLHARAVAIAEGREG